MLLCAQKMDKYRQFLQGLQQSIVMLEAGLCTAGIIFLTVINHLYGLVTTSFMQTTILVSHQLLMHQIYTKNLFLHIHIFGFVNQIVKNTEAQQICLPLDIKLNIPKYEYQTSYCYVYLNCLKQKLNNAKEIALARQTCASQQ